VLETHRFSQTVNMNTHLGGFLSFSNAPSTDAPSGAARSLHHIDG
jgi:hypothetical protein